MTSSIQRTYCGIIPLIFGSSPLKFCCFSFSNDHVIRKSISLEMLFLFACLVGSFSTVMWCHEQECQTPKFDEGTRYLISGVIYYRSISTAAVLLRCCRSLYFLFCFLIYICNVYEQVWSYTVENNNMHACFGYIEPLLWTFRSIKKMLC